MNNKKRRIWHFFEIKVENKRRNFNMFTAEGFSEARPFCLPLLELI